MTKKINERIRSTTRIVAGAVAMPLGLSHAVAIGPPEVPGFDVSEYATIPAGGGAIDKLTIDPGTGAIYLGCTDAVAAIYRVPPGGGEAATYGTRISDPDAVLFDTDGAVSGVPGAVIVGGLITLDVSAQLWAVLPDEQVVSICGPIGTFLNPTCMTFDADGILVMADYNTRSAFDGAPCPEQLFQINAELASIDLDDAGDIYTVATDGGIRIHTREGSLVDDNFASGVGGDSPLQFGPGDETWGDALYVIDRTVTGELRRYASNGDFEVIGTGFVNGRDLEFGPDGALYVSMFEERRVLRISPRASCPADLDGDGSVGVGDLLILLGGWGSAAGDVTGDGTTDVADLLEVLSAWGECD